MDKEGPPRTKLSSRVPPWLWLLGDLLIWCEVGAAALVVAAMFEFRVMFDDNGAPPSMLWAQVIHSRLGLILAVPLALFCMRHFLGLHIVPTILAFAIAVGFIALLVLHPASP